MAEDEIEHVDDAMVEDEEGHNDGAMEEDEEGHNDGAMEEDEGAASKTATNDARKMKNSVSRFDKKALRKLKKDFPFLKQYAISFPGPDDRADTPPRGYMTCYSTYLYIGLLRFPITPFFLSFLKYFKLPLGQLSPWCVYRLIAFEMLSKALGHVTSLTTFRHIFSVVKKVCWYGVELRDKKAKTFVASRNHPKDWRLDYFFIELPDALQGRTREYDWVEEVPCKIRSTPSKQANRDASEIMDIALPNREYPRSVLYRGGVSSVWKDGLIPIFISDSTEKSMPLLELLVAKEPEGYSVKGHEPAEVVRLCARHKDSLQVQALAESLGWRPTGASMRAAPGCVGSSGRAAGRPASVVPRGPRRGELAVLCHDHLASLDMPSRKRGRADDAFGRPDVRASRSTTSSHGQGKSIGSLVRAGVASASQASQLMTYAASSSIIAPVSSASDHLLVVSSASLSTVVPTTMSSLQGTFGTLQSYGQPVTSSAPLAIFSTSTVVSIPLPDYSDYFGSSFSPVTGTSMATISSPPLSANVIVSSSLPETTSLGSQAIRVASSSPMSMLLGFTVPVTSVVGAESVLPPITSMHVHTSAVNSSPSDSPASLSSPSSGFVLSEVPYYGAPPMHELEAYYSSVSDRSLSDIRDDASMMVAALFRRSFEDLARRDHELESLRARLSRRDAEIASLRMRDADREARLATLEQEVHGLRGRVADHQASGARMADFEARLAAACQSRRDLVSRLPELVRGIFRHPDVYRVVTRYVEASQGFGEYVVCRKIASSCPFIPPGSRPAVDGGASARLDAAADEFEQLAFPIIDRLAANLDISVDALLELIVSHT